MNPLYLDNLPGCVSNEDTSFYLTITKDGLNWRIEYLNDYNTIYPKTGYEKYNRGSFSGPDLSDCAERMYKWLAKNGY